MFELSAYSRTHAQSNRARLRLHARNPANALGLEHVTFREHPRYTLFGNTCTHICTHRCYQCGHYDTKLRANVQVLASSPAGAHDLVLFATSEVSDIGVASSVGWMRVAGTATMRPSTTLRRCSRGLQSSPPRSVPGSRCRCARPPLSSHRARPLLALPVRTAPDSRLVMHGPGSRPVVDSPGPGSRPAVHGPGFRPTPCGPSFRPPLRSRPSALAPPCMAGSRSACPPE